MNLNTESIEQGANQVTLESKSVRLDNTRKHLKQPALFWKKLFRIDETKMKLYQNDWKRKKYGEGKKSS